MSVLKYYDGSKWENVNGYVAGDTLPIGAIVPYCSTTAPANWLVCDGSYVSKETYADLYNIIGDDYLDGGTAPTGTFRLPNLKGKVPVGYNSGETEFDTMGETGGEKTHTLTINEMPSHTHAPNSRATTFSGSGANNPGQTAGDRTWNNLSIGNTGGDQPHNNLQPYQVVCYIIKAKQSAGLVANVSNTSSNSQTDTYSCDYINDLLQTTTETITIGTINAGGGLYDQTKAITIPQGYTPISIAGYSIAGGSSASINVARLQINGTNIEYSLFNSASSGSSASTSTLNIKVLFIKVTN